MTQPATKLDTQHILVEEIFPHAPETIWKALTTDSLMERWLGMKPTGFEPVKGTRFTYQITPAGAWDGVIRCEVLEVIPNKQLAYAWKGGHAGNPGYGSLLDTTVTFDLTKVVEGTRVRLVHSGFILPRNDVAFKNMSQGWKTIVGKIGIVSGEQKS